MIKTKFHKLQLEILAGFACLSLAVIFAGCSGSVAENSPEKSKEATPALVAQPSATSSVAAVKSGDVSSPANSPNALPPVEASPEDVCVRFMNLLQAGNRIAAEHLLTRTALITTTKEGLKLQPMGGPTAEYKFDAVRYATSKNQLAQVSYIVCDSVDGEDFEVPITWLVRKQTKGWRISGIILELEDGVIDLLSFENMADVVKLKMAASEEAVADTTDTRQADASANGTMTSSPKLK